jgi:hypothetical protein
MAASVSLVSVRWRAILHKSPCRGPWQLTWMWRRGEKDQETFRTGAHEFWNTCWDKQPRHRLRPSSADPDGGNGGTTASHVRDVIFGEITACARRLFQNQPRGTHWVRISYTRFLAYPLESAWNRHSRFTKLLKFISSSRRYPRYIYSTPHPKRDHVRESELEELENGIVALGYSQVIAPTSTES